MRGPLVEKCAARSVGPVRLLQASTEAPPGAPGVSPTSRARERVAANCKGSGSESSLFTQMSGATRMMRTGFAGCADQFRSTSLRMLRTYFPSWVFMRLIAVNAASCPRTIRSARLRFHGGQRRRQVDCATSVRDGTKEDPEADVNQLEALSLVPSQQRTEEREH